MTPFVARRLRYEGRGGGGCVIPKCEPPLVALLENESILPSAAMRTVLACVSLQKISVYTRDGGSVRTFGRGSDETRGRCGFGLLNTVRELPLTFYRAL